MKRDYIIHHVASAAIILWTCTVATIAVGNDFDRRVVRVAEQPLWLCAPGSYLYC